MSEEATARTSDSGAAAGSESRKKIAGKYDSVEQAIESIDKVILDNFHSIREEQSATRQLLERAFAPSDPATTDVGARGRDDQGYTRGVAGEEDFDQVGFLSAPGKVLKEREGKSEARIVKALESRVTSMIANASIVSRFQAKNPDLDEHEGLVAMHMRQTDPRDGLAKQLNEAAKITRAYLEKLRGKGSSEDESGRTASNEEFEEAPTSRRAEGSTTTTSKERVQTQDEVLAESLAEHRAFKTSRFAPKTNK